MAEGRGFARAPSHEDLEQATLSELHELAAGRGIDRYRLLRKEQLVDALADDGAPEATHYVPIPVEEEPTGDAPPASEEARAQTAAPKVSTEVFDGFAAALEGLRDVIGERVQLLVSDADAEHWLEVSGELGEERTERDVRVTFAVGDSARFALDETLFVSGERWTVDTGDYWRITIEQGRIRLSLSDLR
jgi:hypothetical protein